VIQRTVTADDFAALADLTATDEEALRGRPSHIGETDLGAWLSRTDLERDSILFEEDGKPVAFGWSEPYHGAGIHIGIVAQGSKGRGLGSRLIEFGQERLAAKGLRPFHMGTLAADEAATKLALAHGYEAVRRFYEMAVELTEAPPAATLPDGFAIEPFGEPRAREFHDALEDAWRDHWDYHPTPFDEWWSEKRADPNYEPSLWFVVRHENAIVATVRNDAKRNGGGYVGALGVRRAYRGRGLARALLLHTYGVFFARGERRVSLGVDAASPTGATKLYESVGMQIENEEIMWRKAA
jgi:mycothiol synthase